MTLSTTEKNYWIKELTRILTGKILLTLRQGGNVKLIDEMKELAKKQVLDQLGLTAKFDKMAALQAEKDALERQARALGEEINGISSGIKTVLEGYYVDERNEEDRRRYYYGSASINDMVDQLVMKQYPALLKEVNETGAKVFELLEAQSNLERSIMLSSSSAQAKTFLKKFCEKYGIPLDAEWI